MNFKKTNSLRHLAYLPACAAAGILLWLAADIVGDFLAKQSPVATVPPAATAPAFRELNRFPDKFVVEIVTYKTDAGEIRQGLGSVLYYDNAEDLKLLGQPAPADTTRYRVPEDAKILSDILPELPELGSRTTGGSIFLLMQSCHFSEYLNNGDSFTRDYVSNYDYAGMSLDDIPFDPGMVGISGESFFNFLDNTLKDNPTLSFLEANACLIYDDKNGDYRFLPIPAEKDKASLTKGRWYGYIKHADNKIAVKTIYPTTEEADNFSSGDEITENLSNISIVRIGFADVNGDGCRDVVITFFINSYGHVNSYATLALTRTSPEQKRFSVVTNRK